MHEIKGEVSIFSIVGCPFCIRAKGKLEDLGLPFNDINLDRYKEARKLMIDKTGKKTVPQIFFNGKHIGGWSDFNNLSEEDLNELIKDVTENEAPADAPASFLKSIDKESDDSDDAFDFTCEVDEYAYLKKELQESGIVKDIRSGLKTYKSSFYGKDAVSFLVQTKNLDRGHAVAMCKQLVEKNFGKSVKEKGQIEFRDDETIYRFLEDVQTNALNSEINSDCEPRDGIPRRGIHIVSFIALFLRILIKLIKMLWLFLKTQKFFLAVPMNADFGYSNKNPPRKAASVGEELRKLILSIYNSHLSSDGKKVDYKAIGESIEFKQYQKHTGELKRIDLERASREEKLAFFINVYNALVIHAFVVRGPPTNLWQRYKFFNVVSYVIGGHTYSLNDIENGILRSNRKPLGSLRKPFSKDDPRLQYALEEPEPRIHFALVCGAKSCPPIKTYSSKDIDNQLKLAAESFLEGDDCIVNMAKREVKLSQILKWYKEDFGKTKINIAKWVLDNMGECEKKTMLAELVESNNFKLGYLSYDWGLNS